MGLGRKVGLSIAGVLCALSFVACGGSSKTSTPKCSDKDVQDEVVKTIVQKMIENDFKKHEREKLGEAYFKEWMSIMQDIGKFKFEKIVTEKTDDDRKRVTCSADLTINSDPNKDALGKMFILTTKRELLIDLEPGEEMTDKNFEKLIKKQYGSMSAFNKEKDKEAKKLLEDAKKDKEQEQTVRMEYTAQITDDGKLIVKAHL